MGIEPCEMGTWVPLSNDIHVMTCQLNTISHRRQTYHINLVDQTHIMVQYGLIDKLKHFGICYTIL